MSFAVVVQRRAAREIAAAVRWWRAHRAAAPRRLEEELAEVLRRVADHPGLGVRVARRDVRRLVLRTSGDVILYRIRPRARRVEILALWSPRRATPPGP